MPRLAGQLRHQDPVGSSPGPFLVHLARIEPDYVKRNLISKIKSAVCNALNPAPPRVSR
jgi:hypothetical protein